MRGDKKVGLVQVLALIKSGHSPVNISKKFNIPKQNISYFVCKLKKLGCIEKKGYGVWEYIKPLKQVQVLTTRQGNRKGFTSHKKEIRGHAFVWKIEFMQHFDWKKVIRSYRKKNLTFQLICSGQVYRTIFMNRKIWFSKKGLTIYEAMDFYGVSGFKVKGDAVFQMDKLIKKLLKELGQQFRSYRFTTSREHYGMIKNELARQYNDRKEKMQIKGEDGTTWLWIDDSKSLGELETADTIISRQVQNYWNDHKKHKFQVTPTFVLNQFSNLIEDRKFWAEHQKSHVSAIQDLGSGVKKFNEKIDQLIKIIKKK